MPFDFKKEYREFYQPKQVPALVTLPPVNYIALQGKGDPNEAGGAYQQAIGVLYAVAYTLKMSYRSGREIPGFFEYVVPPLEGFWWQEEVMGVDYAYKAGFCWISALRLPDFVGREDFAWAVEAAGKKKKLDCSGAKFLTLEEGLCVQILHVGSYDSEPESVEKMERFLAENGYQNDFSQVRRHHEIYLSDPNRTAPEKPNTEIRHPVRRV